MKSKYRKLAILIMVCVLVLQPVLPALADLNSDMGDMFQRWGFRQNVTEPGAYNSQTRGFVTGGRVTAKAPTMTIAPFTYQDPYFKAGCGGIDIFGGSFSFINASEFTHFLEVVGQNALGYAFAMGIEAVCPTCNATLKDLRDKMDKLNAFMLDSCSAAKGLVNVAVDTAMEGDLQDCKSNNSETSLSAYDPSNGYLGCVTGKSPKEVLKGNRAADPKNGTGKFDATANQAFQGTDLTENQRQYAMSITGTWATEDVADDETDVGKMVSNCKYYPPTINVADLVTGGTIALLKCGSGSLADGNACQSITTETVTIDGYAEVAKYQMKEILALIKNNSVLTDDQKKFINSVSVVPVLSLLKSLAQSKSDDLAAAMIDASSEMVGLMVASRYIDEYLDQLESGTYKINACAAEKQNYTATMKVVREKKIETIKEYSKIFETSLLYIGFVADLDQIIAQTASSKVIKALQYGT